MGAASGTKPRRRGEASKERLFCSQPFTRYEILGGGGDRGEVFSCCQSWITKSLGNMSERPVADVWNSRAAQKIRRSILDGSFKYCRRDVCPYLQRIDGPVQRIEDVKDERLLEIIQKELTIVPFGPSDIICCFDQSCNLSCPSCRAACHHGDGPRRRHCRHPEPSRERGSGRRQAALHHRVG